MLIIPRQTEFENMFLTGQHIKVLEEGAPPIENVMACELLGRRAALVDVVTAHVKALCRVVAGELNGRVLTLCAPFPFSRQETPSSAITVAEMARKRWGDRFRWPMPDKITRVIIVRTV